MPVCSVAECFPPVRERVLGSQHSLEEVGVAGRGAREEAQYNLKGDARAERHRPVIENWALHSPIPGGTEEVQGSRRRDRP